MTVTVRRRTAALLAALLVAVALATADPARAAEPPAPELHPPSGQTAVKPFDVVTFGGAIDPEATVTAGHLVFYTPTNGRLPTEIDVAGAHVNPARRLQADDSGALSGSWQLTVRDVPAQAGFVALEVDTRQPSGDTATGTSPLVRIDRVRPFVDAAALVAEREIVVRFNETVFYPRTFEEPSAWIVDGTRQVLRVQGSGDTRSLTLLNALDQDATPTVEFRPLEGTLSPVHHDEAGWTLDPDQSLRTTTALDEILPPVPTITLVDGTDAAEAVLGNDPTPTVRVGEIRAGHTANLYLESDGVDGFSAGDDPIGTGEATSHADGTYADITTDPLTDGTHTIYAEAVDPSGNVSDGADDAVYDLDRVAPHLVPPAQWTGSELVVSFSESVTGPDRAGDWRIAGSLAVVTGVSGEGATRFLEVTGDPAGAELVYDPSGEPYRDAHGNALDGSLRLPIVASLPVLTVSDVTVAENDSLTLATFDLTMSSPAESTVAVTWETRDGTAAAGADYVHSSGTARILPGSDSATIVVPVLGDDLDEWREHFEVHLLEVQEGNATFASSEQAAVGVAAIEDDDLPSLASVSAASVDEGADAEVPVELDRVSGKDITVTWEVVSGTAALGSDLDAQTGEVTIPAGEAATTIVIGTSEDNLDEPDEGFTVRLRDAVNGGIGQGEADVTIVDDDPLAGVSIGDARLTEGHDGATSVELRVALDRASGKEITVEWATADGSATAGQDYEAASGTLTFAPGQTSDTITVEVLGDTEHEGDESFAVDLTSATGADITDGSGRVTIEDDDASGGEDPSDPDDDLPLPGGPGEPPTPGDEPPLPGDPGDPGDPQGFLEQIVDWILDLFGGDGDPSDDPSDDPGDDPSGGDDGDDGDDDGGSDPDPQGLVDDLVDTVRGFLPGAAPDDPDGGNGGDGSDDDGSAGGDGSPGGGSAGSDDDVNAAPDLPRTGGGLAGLGLLALLGAGTIRRRR